MTAACERRGLPDLVRATADNASCCCCCYFFLLLLVLFFVDCGLWVLHGHVRNTEDDARGLAVFCLFCYSCCSGFCYCYSCYNCSRCCPCFCFLLLLLPLLLLLLALFYEDLDHGPGVLPAWSGPQPLISNIDLVYRVFQKSVPRPSSSGAS